jgi:phosphatidylethanolamine/phosphatidyl-N-methylethanolamine N-methyltransferase
MGADFDKSSVERAYARWAPVYDLVFGAVFDGPARSRSKRPSRPVDRPVGASSKSGSAPVFPEYARRNRLVGIDLSEPMLRRAPNGSPNKADYVEGLA